MPKTTIEPAADWTCARCDVKVSWTADVERPALPVTWIREDNGLYCLACRRDRAGEAALVGLDEETSARVPSFPVDTRGETGADDAFAGGLIHGLLNGWPLAPAVRLGNAVGALSTRGTGASSALPDLEEALAL